MSAARPSPIAIARVRLAADSARAEAAAFVAALDAELVRALGDTVPAGLAERPLRWAGPMHQWLAWRALPERLPGAELVAQRLLRASRRIPPPLHPVRLRPQPGWLDPALLVLRAAVAAAVPASATAEIAPVAPVAWPTVCEAVDLVADVWPEAAIEMRLLVREIVFLSPGWLRSCTVASAFGAVFLCPRPDWTSLEVFELLLHETAHIALDVKTSMLPFLEGNTALASSPLRDDPRPLPAVLHAAFVLARVLCGLRRLARFHPGQFGDRPVRLAETFRRSLSEACQSLEATASWTTAGRHLFADIERIACDPADQGEVEP